MTKKSKTPDLSKLQGVLDLAAAYTMPQQAADLLQQLENDEVARVSIRTGKTFVKIHGLQASSHQTRHTAMLNWLQAARRTITRNSA